MNMKTSHLLRNILAISFLALVFTSAGAGAQTLNVSFDFATFRYDSAKTYMELYYSFDMRTMKLMKKDSVFSDTLLFHIRMQRTGPDSTNYYESWGVPVDARDTTSKELEHNLVSQIALLIPPGNYLMYVEVLDRNDTSRIDSVKDRIVVPRYSSRKLETSDVELCSQITQSDSSAHGVFYKNTYDVIPNPNGIYGAGLPIIYYYMEVYNIPDSSGDTLFTVEYQIRDSFGQVLKSRESARKKFGNTSVEVGTINGSNLKTGAYTLLITVNDSVAGTHSTSSRRFFVYNPGLGAPESAGTTLAGASVLSSVFATMDDAQISREFTEARYIATPTAIEQFNELQSLPAKRQFLYDFWKKRNPNPVLNTNTYRSEYIKRVAYANAHFNVGNTSGWRTDRGRVYIIYGNPDQIDRHPNEGNSKPYEIWYYNSIQGGVSFDFVDRTGFGDYTLVNSTARNEIQNDNWQQYLGSN
ncbi:MAG TPA: GWxTD domain-containing protein [Candidatus Kryptobacter bacterium]|nr:GWxTD domain-containing protein [Candidatus Kryptobacter bacterium]